MKYSKQRELIKKAVLFNPVHPTAEEVYNLLRKDNPNISLGTVYRNLNKLSEINIIQKIPVPNAADHFDGRTDTHYHIFCTKCGKMHDVEFSGCEECSRVSQINTDYVVKGFKLIFYGICKKCQKSENKKERG